MLTVGKIRAFLDEVELKRVYPFELPFNNEEITFFDKFSTQLLDLVITDGMNGIVLSPTNTPNFLLPVEQGLLGIRTAYNQDDALIGYYESVGMFRGMYYGKLFSSDVLIKLTELASNAFLNYHKPFMRWK